MMDLKAAQSATITGQVLVVSNLGKCYRLYHRPIDRLKQVLAGNRKKYFHENWSLRAVDFQVPEGQTVGIIGCNGAGKTTLLRIISGVISPTEGSVRRRGKVFALLELGCGFNPDFTGRENIHTSGMVLGLNNSQARALSGCMVDFAEIGEHIDEPLRTYSSGMTARVAMAVALHIPADLILIDEILSVGDVFFQMKCFNKVAALMKEGRTVLLCSHDLGAVRRYCSRVIYLREGRIEADGDPDNVLSLYLNSREDQTDNGVQQAEAEPVSELDRHDQTNLVIPVPPEPDRRLHLEISAAEEWQPDEDFQSLVRNPRGLAFVEGGNILVADLFSHSLVEVTRGGRVVGKWGRTGFEPGAIYDPVCIDTMEDGGVAVADYTTNQLLVIYRDGGWRPLLEKQIPSGQPFVVRIGPDGKIWVSCAADGSLWVVDPGEQPRKLMSEDNVRRYIADVAFDRDKAYLADFRNHEILVFDAIAAICLDTIPLGGCGQALAPHGIRVVNGMIIMTCHDSHSLACVELCNDRRPVAAADLCRHMINHPCYLLIDGPRAYVSASTMGGVAALNISVPVKTCEGQAGVGLSAARSTGISGNQG